MNNNSKNIILLPFLIMTSFTYVYNQNNDKIAESYLEKIKINRNLNRKFEFELQRLQNDMFQNYNNLKNEKEEFEIFKIKFIDFFKIQKEKILNNEPLKEYLENINMFLNEKDEFNNIKYLRNFIYIQLDILKKL